MKKDICCSLLNDTAESLKVQVCDFKHTCFFCRTRGEKFSIHEMVPEGMCPDLFFQIYPQYLGLLYDGCPGLEKGKLREALLYCPGNKAKTLLWRITSKKLPLSLVINIADKIFRFIGKPKDLFDRKIVLELIDTKGVCPRGYQGKVKFVFNQYSHIWGRRFFCPAVFYTLYPFLLANEQKGHIQIQCPADYTSIVFEISRSTEE
ncbi:MAG: hypothetical protein AB1414_17440 [bacterium]